MQLRPDQRKFVADIRAALHDSQAVMGQAPTGFGKTVVTSYITRSAYQNGKRVTFAVHRDNLITQSSGTFDQFGIPHGFIAAGRSYNRNALVNVAGIDTLKRRLDVVVPPDYLIIDEAHLAMAAGWQTVVDYYKARGAKVIGNSATPQRLDGRPLGNLFDSLVLGPDVRWLMDEGHLSDYRYFAPDVPDMSTIRKQMGDFSQKGAGDVMDRPKLIGSVVAHYKQLARGKRAICFCMNVAHSHHTVAEFVANGVPATHIDGNTPHAERRRILNDFADGKIHVLCNVELVTTGFDLSAQVGRDVPVECVILCRPTMSLALFLQMVGRALRKKLHPAIILDHAGNSSRHGFPDDPREWSLDGEEGGKGGSREGPPPPFTCGNCFMQVRRPLPPCCPNCGQRLSAEAKPVEVGEGQLIEVTADMKAAQRRQRKDEEREAKTLQQLVALGAQRGYANPQKWAFQKWSNSRYR